MPEEDKQQAVIDAMWNDPAGHQGPRVIQEELAHAGINLTRYVLMTLVI